MPATISLINVTWSPPEQEPLFSQLNLNFGPARTGLVGRNGIGKTSILKLITGDLTPQSGKVLVNCRLGVMRQVLQVSPNETIADLFDIRQALTILRRVEQGEANEEELIGADWTLETRLESALTRLGLEAEADAGTALSTLSGGQRTRASLAALLFSNPDFLLLDEPTNNLDRDGRERVIQTIAAWQSGAIVVSHDRELLEYMDAIVELTTLGATKYGGNWSQFRETKSQELIAAQRTLADAEKRVADVNRNAQAAAERHARTSSTGHKNAAKGGAPRIVLGMMKNRSENTGGENARLAERRREEAVNAAAEARERIEILQPLTVQLSPTNLPTGKVVVRVEELTVGYSPGQPILENLSFEIIGPERVALNGPNGAGKTTLLAVLMRDLMPWRGKVEILTSHTMLDQQVSVLDPALTIFDNFQRQNPDTDQDACRAALARFMFRADAALRVAGTLSGGELLRAGLACVLGGPTPPALLILDEPTNHLDIDSIEAVEGGLRGYDGALLIVSHDESFLDAVGTTRQLILQPTCRPDKRKSDL